jgi:hypothetical protein
MKKTKKNKAAKSTRDLPAKSLKAKTSKSIKGGGTIQDAPKESISFNYTKPTYTYNP